MDVSINLNTVLTAILTALVLLLAKSLLSRLNSIREAIWAQNGRIKVLETRTEQHEKVDNEFHDRVRTAHQDLWEAVDEIRRLKADKEK